MTQVLDTGSPSRAVVVWEPRPPLPSPLLRVVPFVLVGTAALSTYVSLPFIFARPAEPASIAEPAAVVTAPKPAEVDKTPTAVTPPAPIPVAPPAPKIPSPVIVAALPPPVERLAPVLPTHHFASRARRSAAITQRHMPRFASTMQMPMRGRFPMQHFGGVFHRGGFRLLGGLFHR